MLKSTRTLECWLIFIFGKKKKNEHNNERCQDRNNLGEEVQHHVMSVTKGDRRPYQSYGLERTRTPAK